MNTTNIAAFALSFVAFTTSVSAFSQGSVDMVIQPTTQEVKKLQQVDKIKTALKISTERKKAAPRFFSAYEKVPFSTSIRNKKFDAKSLVKRGYYPFKNFPQVKSKNKIFIGNPALKKRVNTSQK